MWAYRKAAGLGTAILLCMLFYVTVPPACCVLAFVAICLSERAKAFSRFSYSACLPISKVEVKPYVLDDQVCDECHGMNCGGRYAPYFCGNIHCLRYYCEHCWAAVHAAPGTQNHRCFIKENGDRPRAINFFPSQPRMLPKASLLAAATSCRH